MAVSCVILLVFLIYALFFREAVLIRYQADLDNDGVPDTLTITGKPLDRYGDYFIIETAGRTYQYDMRELNPWKVQTADVDGDGKIEISIGVYKTARFHPVEDKRPFIYDWSEEGIAPKWLGSRLSRPFDDYIFADIDDDGMDELVSIEILIDGRKAVNSYKWKGFGFEGIGESESFDDVMSISRGMYVQDKGMEILADVLTNGIKERITLTHYDGKLVRKGQ